MGMDQNIKNRLVGMAVIFALAVIFLPMILDGSGVRKDKFEVVIPPQPVVSPNPEFDQKMIELEASVEDLPELEARYIDEHSTENRIERKTGAEPETTAGIAKSKPKPKAKAKIGGESWVLQVGSYQDRGKAMAQRDKLRISNIAAVFIEQFHINNKISYRVRLGPFIDRDLTRIAQNKIKAKHNIDGIIMKYER